jgi:hypothetical protein
MEEEVSAQVVGFVASGVKRSVFATIELIIIIIIIIQFSRIRPPGLF